MSVSQTSSDSTEVTTSAESALYVVLTSTSPDHVAAAPVGRGEAGVVAGAARHETPWPVGDHDVVVACPVEPIGTVEVDDLVVPRAEEHVVDAGTRGCRARTSP
jgi:hypothetical protein